MEIVVWRVEDFLAARSRDSHFCPTQSSRRLFSQCADGQ
jgi:hypothetical protein